MPGVTRTLSMNSSDFDRWITLAEREAHAIAVKADDAFVAAMNRAIRKGRCKAEPGTFVDLTPPIGARRIHAEISRSSCGSPAALCGEN